MNRSIFLPLSYQRSSYLRLYRHISLVSRLRQERRDAKLSTHEEPRPTYLSTRDDVAVDEEHTSETLYDSLHHIKSYISQLPRPLSVAQKRNAIQQFEALAAFVECLNVLEEPSLEPSASDSYAVSIALACGVRYLTVDELLALLDPLRSSSKQSIEPSKFYYSFAQLYQKAKFPLDPYFYEVLFSKLLRACVPGSSIPLTMMRILAELTTVDPALVTVYHERCILRALINAEFSSPEIESQLDKMIGLQAIDFSSLSTYFLWACRKDGHVIDDIINRLCMLQEHQVADRSEQDTMLFLEYLIFSNLLKKGRLGDALELFSKYRMAENAALMQHHAEHFAVALLKSGSWLWEPIRQFFSTFVFDERVVNGIQYVDIRPAMASSVEKKISLIGSLLPKILKTDHHMGKSLVTTLKQMDRKPSLSGYHCLLPVLLSPFFSEQLKYELLFIYTGVLVRRYDFVFHPDSPASTLFSSLVSLFPSMELRNTMQTFLSHLHSQELEPNLASVNLVVHELATPWAESIRMQAFGVLLSSKLLGQRNMAKPWLWDFDGGDSGSCGDWDAKSLNTFLLMAREAAEYALVSFLLRLLKAKRAVIFPANLDLVSNEHRIYQTNVRMKGILPHQADLTKLEAKMHELAQEGPVYNNLTENLVHFIACLRSHGIATVYDVRRIKSWQWLPLLRSWTRDESVDESLVELAKEATKEPTLSVAKVQWHASKADMKGESSSASAPALGSVVVNKKGQLTRFKYPG